MIKAILCPMRLEATPWGTAVRESTWLFPTIESIHVLCLVMVVGSIMVVDLRLLNLASRQRSVKELTDDVLPWTWTAFVGAAITGTLLFSSSAMRYSGHLAVRGQDVPCWCWRPSTWASSIWAPSGPWRNGTRRRRGRRWPRSSPAEFRCAIWVTIVALGRWVGFA